MVQTILTIISEALPLIDKVVPDEATKIRNKVLDLRRRWDDEISKGSERNDNALDHIQSELLDLGRLFSDTLKQASSKDK